MWDHPDGEFWNKWTKSKSFQCLEYPRNTKKSTKTFTANVDPVVTNYAMVNSPLCKVITLKDLTDRCRF